MELGILIPRSQHPASDPYFIILYKSFSFFPVWIYRST